MKPTNIEFEDHTKTLELSSLTLKQKIGQMIITYEQESNTDEIQNLFIGGVYFAAQSNKGEFIRKIDKLQEGAVVPLFIAADLEGCINPFDNFQEFPDLDEIETKEKAYQIGYEEGKLLKELGFHINLAPVVDLQDDIWKCRSFTGTPEEISEKAVSYVSGLQEHGILATSKHYPGKTLTIRDPHLHITTAAIDETDLLPFKQTIENDVSCVMVSHLIVYGSADSEAKPSVVSDKLINDLRTDFSGLIITDDIGMLGLRNYYETEEQLYIDLFKADNDLILYFEKDPKTLHQMISSVEDAVNRGEISEEKIDRSVTRILTAKGITVT